MRDEQSDGIHNPNDPIGCTNDALNILNANPIIPLIESPRADPTRSKIYRTGVFMRSRGDSIQMASVSSLKQGHIKVSLVLYERHF